MSRDHAIAHEFTNHTLPLSPASALRSPGAPGSGRAEQFAWGNAQRKEPRRLRVWALVAESGALDGKAGRPGPGPIMMDVALNAFTCLRRCWRIHGRQRTLFVIAPEPSATP